nr:FAD/NAD(P)-binding oxidoreductase family protein [Tanacetum cinerariifolium]
MSIVVIYSMIVTKKTITTITIPSPTVTGVLGSAAAAFQSSLHYEDHKQEVLVLQQISLYHVERWVLRSTEQYAEKIIAQAGLQKPSNAALIEIAEELFKEFQRTGFDMSAPFFKKAHRWGSAFPVTSMARDEKCIWDGTKKLAICGDFCVSPNVEGAILSGLTAASIFSEAFSRL